MKKSVVLVSGGLDSVTNLYAALKQSKVELAITFDYGQMAAQRELEAAKYFCQVNGIPHKVIQLPWFSDIGRSSLLDRKLTIPQGSDVDILNHAKSEETAKSVWVPNRNGIFMNIAAGFAEAVGAHQIVPGFNLEEASTFPDNSQEFMNTLDRAFEYSTASKVKVHCYTVGLVKLEIVKLAKSFGVPLDKLWPCYFGGETWCGQCESCLRFKRAVKSQGFDQLSNF